MIVLILLILTLMLCIYVWQKKLYSTWKALGVPQAPVCFPLGSLKLSQHFIYTMQQYYTSFKDKTNFVGTYNTLKPSILVIGLDLVKQILVKDFHYFQARGFYHNEKDDPLSANLFLIDGPKWKALRTKLTPTFTSGKMKVMCPLVIEIGNRFKEVMDKEIEAGGQNVDVREIFARFTTDVIGTCAFGLECNSLNDPSAEFRQMGAKALKLPLWNVFKRILTLAYPNILKKLGTRTFSQEVNNFFIKTVNDTVKHRLKNNIKRDDFMGLLIALRNENKKNSIKDSDLVGLSMNEISAQCFVFFLAGFETSSTAASFTLYELAKNSGVQEKVRVHIRKVIKKHHDQITYEALKDMTYLEQCISEGMRMYPPVPLLSRKNTAPYKLPGTDVTLEVETMVSIPTYAIHHDPDIYPDPEVFDPDRFTPDEIAKRHPFSYLAFGEGPRNCIGERFGMMQAKIGLAILLINYNFTLSANAKKIRFKPQSFILTIKDNIYFNLQRA